MRKIDYFKFLLKLYRDLSAFEYYYSRDKKMAESILERIIGKLKSAKFLGKNASIIPIYLFPIELFTKSPNSLSENDLARIITTMRISVEKRILSTKIPKELISKRGTTTGYKLLSVIGDINEYKDGFEFISGTTPVLLVVAHATDPYGEEIALRIARKIQSITDSFLLISKVSRIYSDYNRSYTRVLPFRRKIEELTLRRRKVKIILDFHEFSKNIGYDVVIGSRLNISANKKILILLEKFLNKYEIKYTLNYSKYSGGDIVAYHSLPPIVQAIQLEIFSEIDKNAEKRIVKAISGFIRHFSKGVNHVRNT